MTAIRREPLDGGHLSVCHLRDRQCAGANRFAIQVDGEPDQFDEIIAGREERARKMAEEFSDVDDDIDATHQASFEDVMGDLDDANVGQGLGGELLSDDFDLSDDFNIDEDPV